MRGVRPPPITSSTAAETGTASRSRGSPRKVEMAKGTPATVALTKAGVAFTLHEYDYDPNAARIGMQAAEALGVSPARLLKTLMAKAANATVSVLVPSDAAGRRSRAPHRISCRWDFTVRPEEARARVRRAIHAHAGHDHCERRPARIADRACGGGTGAGAGCYGGGVECLNSLLLIPA